MKFYIVASILSFIGSCATLSHKEKIENIKNSIIINQPSQIVSYANTITARELNNHLYQFASTDFEGRNVGNSGHKKASNYLRDYYISQNIPSPLMIVFIIKLFLLSNTMVRNLTPRITS